MSSPMDKMFESTKALPSIPKALQEILQTLSDDDTSLTAIVEPLSHDPALSVKVLRMSNSAHFGLPKQVDSVEEAVLLVGMNAIRTLVIASGLIGSFNDIPGFDMKRFWRLSVLSGMIARDWPNGPTNTPSEPIPQPSCTGLAYWPYMVATPKKPPKSTVAV
ncbi:MAG: HDOD domain-containing protein [Limnobacter sp.]|nr:HDOD domain-containing protein [Limnobacter sp.]